MYKGILAVLSVFILAGCNSEDPNPELRDKIYLDLKQELESHKALLEEHKGYLKESKEKYESSKPHSVERVAARRDIKKRKEQIKEYDAQVKYLEIRTERRMYLARRSYKLARAKGEKWPDEQEYEHYLINKKLVNANLDWGRRVPKLFKASSKYNPKKYDVPEEE